MKNMTMAAAALLALAGCASEFAVPVTGMIGDTPAQGEAIARTDGAGRFTVYTLDGLSCGGTYNSLTTSPTIQMPVACTDGRTGRLIATRTGAGLSGTVIGRLNDGTEGRFVFGDLVFSQAFPGGGATTR